MTTAAATLSGRGHGGVIEYRVLLYRQCTSTSVSVVCYRRDSGTSCVSDGNECAWCATTRQCFAFVEYVPRYPFGGCRHWFDGVAGLGSDADTDNCTRWSDCRSCLQHFMCGWCSLTHNPTIGICYRGDFSGNCSFHLRPCNVEMLSNWW